jgi:glycosyltransferase involved in cell wall biosynthesis
MFVANSQGSAKTLSKVLAIPGSQVAVIYNGIDLPRISSLASQPVTSIDLDEDDRFLLNIGRLTYAKRQDVLIRSFSRLKDQKLKLVILGEGPLKSKLEALTEQLGVQGRVIFAGFVNNPYAFAARARALVLSSCYEGMPTVLLEALSCGCPVVSTDCPSGPREILADGKWGDLVPVNDVEALAQAIEICLITSRDRSFLEKRAREFSVDVMTDKYYMLLFGASN